MRWISFVPYVLLVFVVTLFVSCSDFIETDISKKSITLFAPKDNIHSGIYSVNYWWDELPSATKYRLQIVQTDALFHDSISLTIDTLVSKNQFRKAMNPGNYFWSVFAVNGAYNSVRSPVWRLTIDSATIAGQDFNLITPAPGTDTSFVSTSPFALSWEALSGAKKYMINVDSTTGARTVKTTDKNSYSLNLGGEGLYRVSVFAINGSLQSNTTPSASIFYDKTSPDSVILSTPENSATALIDTTRSLNWETSKDKQSGILKYVLTLTGTNKNFTSGALKTTSYPLTGMYLRSQAVYQWKVTATDRAGNTKESKTFSFKVR